jgi:uncharacterized membrane protein
MTAEKNHHTGEIVCNARNCEQEAREKVSRVIRDADALAEKLKQARNIDPEELNKPMTI